MSALSVGLLSAIATGLVLGWFLHNVTCQRDGAVRLLAKMSDALDNDARRIRVLRDDNVLMAKRMASAADTINMLGAERARLTIELDHARHALAVQIAGPDRMALLGNNVVPIRSVRS